VGNKLDELLRVVWCEVVELSPIHCPTARDQSPPPHLAATLFDRGQRLQQKFLYRQAGRDQRFHAAKRQERSDDENAVDKDGNAPHDYALINGWTKCLDFG
jgi:hypothetical protein